MPTVSKVPPTPTHGLDLLMPLAHRQSARQKGNISWLLVLSVCFPRGNLVIRLCSHDTARPWGA